MRKIKRILVVLILLVSGFSRLLIIAPSAESEYTLHDPISIDGNDDFATQAAIEGWPGDGTEGNPYVIEGYEIIPSYEDGISISGTDVHFIIRDVYVYSTYHNYYSTGISLENIFNGSVKNITTSDMYTGIRLFYSNNVTIIGNRFTSNGIVISGYDLHHYNSHCITSDNLVNDKPLYYHKDDSGLNIEDIPVGQLILANCTNIRAANLTITNTSVGIQMAFVDHGNITGNNISFNNNEGMQLVNSTNIQIIDNNFFSNGRSGIDLSLSRDIIILNNDLCSNGFYGIGIRSSINVTIKGNNILQNGWNGVDLWYSSKVTLTQNNISSSEENGIELNFASEVNITNNKISNNQLGICLEDSLNTIITNNSFNSGGIFLSEYYYSYIDLPYYNTHTISTDNRINGKPIYYYKNRDNVDIDGVPVGQLILVNCSNIRAANLTISNVEVGIQMIFVDDAYIIGSEIYSNNLEGIQIFESKNVHLIDSNLSLNNEKGLYIESSSNITLQDNYIYSNVWKGIELHNCINVSIVRNSISSHFAYGWLTVGFGLHLLGTKEVIITDNNIWNNNRGIYLESSSNFIIEGNNISDNNIGISLDSCYDTIINSNSIINESYGIELTSSSAVIISNNGIMNNYYGIELTSSNDNIVNNNIVLYNQNGIYLDISYNNTVTNNNASNNSNGIFIYHSAYNNITNNTFSYNDYYGIYLHDSYQNNITDNMILKNGKGISLIFSNHNIFHHNEIISNSEQLFNSSSANIWNDGEGEGNYWSDYTGIDKNGDGVGDTNLPHHGVDHYPLTEPNIVHEKKWSIFTDPLALISLIAIIIIFAIILGSFKRINRLAKMPSEIEDEESIVEEQDTEAEKPQPPLDQQEKQ